MRVAVTGGSGKIGRYVLLELVAHGHEAVDFDRVPPSKEGPNCPYRQVDLCHFEEISDALKSHPFDAVVHLANWPSDGLVPDSRTYADNVSATFNLFQASAEAGIRRILYASSNHVYGLAGAPPLFLPLTEEHPMLPVSPYGLSKVAGEQAAEYFSRNRNMTVLSFRLLGIRTPAEMPREIEQVKSNPENKSYLLWTRCDTRDAALAFRLALEKTDVASGAYNITGPRIVLERPAEGLVREFFGEQMQLRAALPGHSSPFSIDKAGREFGYQPRFAWSESEAFPE
jgi:nucleoside-diphosphate-sugar epimerase